jgi:hypothetical protein
MDAMTDFDDLVTFLRARLDEDEDDPGGWSAARVRAEVDAKRRIIDEHHRSGVMCPRCSLGTEDGEIVFELDPCQTLRLIALPYAGHPAYRPEWAPAVPPTRSAWPRMHP